MIVARFLISLIIPGAKRNNTARECQENRENNRRIKESTRQIRILILDPRNKAIISINPITTASEQEYFIVKERAACLL